MKHRVTLAVADKKGGQTTALTGAQKRLPMRLLRFLFGDFTNIYVLKPGETVMSIDVKEVNE